MSQVLSWQYLTNIIMVVVPEQMWLRSDGSLALKVMV